ncbi:hypothetical protein NQ318_003078 [Aromia moschata]|uniref:Uncharacterized protein n=1 Tax=Aromia moschata TaxID=1265417 RepID=A0AAV8XQG9_9CUCU|nr:hypothetical protein NQ318_003078 [Aromia moschata]
MGCFPDKLKTSTITPIPKIINASNAKDFRPIKSLPPVEMAVYEQITEYFNSNKLLINNQSVLNVNKTKSMIITTQYKYERLDINNINIVYENKSNRISLIIDNNLTFKEHLTIANSLSIMTCITVYKSIIQPHFDYCATILYMLDKLFHISITKITE